MRPPCGLGLTDGHLDISESRLKKMLRFSGNLEETCICTSINSNIIMRQLTIFSVTKKGKTFSQTGGGLLHAPTLF